MEYEYFEEHLSGSTSKCEDCGYVGKDYVEPLSGEGSTLEGEADVLCPKCKSYYYFCI
jgi:Zn finger protein HypA/HybF involved in hydrogenase expression